jgi:hypothetical protein
MFSWGLMTIFISVVLCEDTFDPKTCYNSQGLKFNTANSRVIHHPPALQNNNGLLLVSALLNHCIRHSAVK